jgi:ArsR family transcriptional regulator
VGSVFKEYSQQFNALSDELRLKVLQYLYVNGEKCVCDISTEFDIGQSGMSYHLKILTDANLIHKKQIAVWNYYSINRGHQLFPVLEDIFRNMDIKGED